MFFGVIDNTSFTSVLVTSPDNVLDLNVVYSEVAQTPLPAALPLFAGGLGAMGLLGWRRKRKNSAALAAV